MEFAGERLKLARLAMGATQSALAELVGSSNSYISEIERGLKSEPGELFVEAVADELGFSPGFFYKSDSPVFESEAVNFRRRSSVPEWRKAQVAAIASLFAQVVVHLDELFGFPPLDVPEFSAGSDDDIEEAAARCRQHWGLDLDAPIDSMVRVVENAGVVVTTMSDADKVDAFSAVRDSVAVVVLNDSFPATRVRFSLGHELAHLSLHRGIVTGDRETEFQADRFSSAFLMPSKSFSREFRQLTKMGWPHLFELKRRWKVSVAAIVRRAFDLDLIGPAEYRRRYKYMSARGWRKGEPHEPPSEAAELLPIAIQELERSFGETPEDLAKRLGFAPRTLERVARLHVKVTPELPRNVANLRAFRAKRRHSGIGGTGGSSA
ncbi:MAG TPA: XRE family transcriptional regulator [Planctomycetota bacterium]|nr:XRE family transcriptional regulator [Planctomycetota bacterium]